MRFQKHKVICGEFSIQIPPTQDGTSSLYETISKEAVVQYLRREISHCLET